MARFLAVVFISIAVFSLAVAAEPAPQTEGPICCACIAVKGEMDVAENGALQEAIFCSSVPTPGDIDPLSEQCEALEGKLACLAALGHPTDPATASDPADDAACAEALKSEDIACPAVSGAAAPVLGATSLGVLAVLLTGAGVLVLRRRGIVRS